MAERKLRLDASGSRNRFGRRLRELREEVGMSQSDVCRQAQLRGWDLAKQVLSTIELGERSLSDLELMALLEIVGKGLSDLEP